MDRKKILIIRNPYAGRPNRLLVDQVVAELGKSGAVPIVQNAADEQNSQSIARTAVQNSAGYDLIVAAGGDGTINKVAAGLYDGGIPLGVIPAGSANVLVRDLGLEPGLLLSPALLSRALIFNPLQPLYLCEAQTGTGSHPFVAMASVGFDARAVANISLALKARIGRTAYAIAGFRELLGTRPARVTLKWPGGTCEANWVIAAKTRHYAGPFVLDQTIDIRGPALTVYAVNYNGPVSLLGHLAALKQGRLGHREGVRTIHTDQLEIDGEACEPVQLDGDLAGYLPVTLKVLKKPLKVVIFNT